MYSISPIKAEKIEQDIPGLEPIYGVVHYEPDGHLRVMLVLDRAGGMLCSKSVRVFQN